MATLRYTVRTGLTPAQFIAGLTDFGPGRKELFRYSTNGHLKVHQQGPTSADVTEGSAGIWERLSYDWSDPHHVVLTTTDSNLWGPGSGHTYDLAPQPDGSTKIDATVQRNGKGLRGKFVETFVSTVGKGMLAKTFAASVKAIEARQAKPHSGS